MYPGKVALQQRVIPAYRAPFFDLLAQYCAGGLTVFAGRPLPVEGITPATRLEVARFVPARNRHFTDPSRNTYLCWQQGILDWLRSEDPDALIVEANPRNLSTWRAVAWMKRRGRRVVGWGLGAPPQPGIAGKLLDAWRRAFLRRLDAVIAYSRRGAVQYHALGMPPERIFVAVNAVAPRPTQSPPTRPPDFAEKPVVLFVGRLQARKRLDLLFQACAALPPERQPRVIVVGDGPARAHFEALAQQVYPQVEFVGARHGADLDPLFTQADLFVLPGTGGLAVQQALAHGLPVIVAQGDGTQDDLVRPENGWQVPPGDVDALRAVLAEALADPARLRRMGEYSFRIVRDEVNLERMVAVFLKALRVREKGSEETEGAEVSDVAQPINQPTNQ